LTASPDIQTPGGRGTNHVRAVRTLPNYAVSTPRSATFQLAGHRFTTAAI
jgi:hypothetical protein